jgi:uncharacterized protein
MLRDRQAVRDHSRRTETLVASAVHAEVPGLVTTEEELRGIVGQPRQIIIDKILPRLDVHSINFIRASPFVVLSTCDADGNCDASPRGDAAGFAVIDSPTRIYMPEWAGNRRADTLVNVVVTSKIGMVFFVPGFGEVLRVNGSAWISKDEELRGRLRHGTKIPPLAIAVDVEEVYLHCARAIRRSALWSPSEWPSTEDLPSFAEALAEQADVSDMSVEELDAWIRADYESLY